MECELYGNVMSRSQSSKCIDSELAFIGDVVIAAFRVLLTSVTRVLGYE